MTTRLQNINRLLLQDLGISFEKLEKSMKKEYEDNEFKLFFNRHMNELSNQKDEAQGLNLSFKVEDLDFDEYILLKKTI